MPVGPSILWPVKPKKSTPRASTSVGRAGTCWAPSTRTSAPAAWAASASRRTGLMVPSTLDSAVTPTQLGPVEGALEVVEDQLTVVVEAAGSAARCPAPP